MDKFAKELKEYVGQLKERYAGDPEKAKSEARSALIRTGVLTPDGKPKESIVTRY